jgi:heme-degrading monooxygenase HmoA
VTGVSGPVTMINAFTVPRAESERFLQRWLDNARIMAGQPGYLGAKLHRALSDNAELRFINVAQWASEESVRAATANPGWRRSMRRMLDDPELHVTPRPAVYEVVAELHPGDAGL